MPLSVVCCALVNSFQIIILKMWLADSWLKLIATLTINKIEQERGIIFSCKLKTVAFIIISNSIIF